MSKLRISSSLNLHHYPKDDISEYIRQGLAFCKKLGFDAVDFPSGIFALMGDDWETLIPIAVEDAAKLGLRFEICHLPFGVNKNDAPERIEAFNASVHRAIDAAKLLGVDYAVLHPNSGTIPLDDYDPKAEYDMVIEHLTPFAEHAAKVGLNIVVENMRYLVTDLYPVRRYCGTPEELCKVADALGIGICWDFGHANINGLKQSEALAYVGSRLKVLHVNDNFAWGDDHVAPFMGKIDWADAMKGLRDIGFNGLLNYEIGTGRIPAGARESFAQYLMDAAHQLLEMM